MEVVLHLFPKSQGDLACAFWSSCCPPHSYVVCIGHWVVVLCWFCRGLEEGAVAGEGVGVVVVVAAPVGLDFDKCGGFISPDGEIIDFREKGLISLKK